MNITQVELPCFMVTDCLGALLTGFNIARRRVSENHLRETKFPDKATGCLEKLMRNKTVLKLALSPQKGNVSHIWK